MTLFKKYVSTKSIIIFSMLVTLMTGCSSTSNSANKSSNNAEKVIDSTKQNSNTGDSKSSTNKPSNSSDNNSSNVEDSSKVFLSNIMQSAKQGKVINCEFTDKTNVIEDVKEKWGEPDKIDWVPAAKGNYATYSEHNIVFGFNKGSQIFEVRSFDSRIKKITLSKVKEVFGTPAYDVKSNGEEVIGYVATKEFKILFVFPQSTSNNKDLLLDHYSVLYPQGTVNSMADDPGRQW
ncbi:YjgB family protein [Clostridium sp. WILCCON 0269]|uniref:YjgB family protein n=1 Tax=Candidatus Clostridium eludens TaxID=3381663 RepID=A0ABW8SQG0_9CLOT